MKQNFYKLFFTIILTLTNCITLIAADSGTSTQISNPLTSKADTFITKKVGPKKEEKNESIDVYDKLSSESNASLIAASIGLGTIFFLPVIGFIGNIISIKKNKKINAAIKDKIGVPESLKSNLQISNILNIVAGIIHGLYALLIILYIVVIVLIILAFGI